MSTHRILQVLRSNEAGRIRFSFPAGGATLTVSHTTFLSVARAIERNVIAVTISTALPPGVGAQYVQPNAIVTPPVIGRVDEGLVLHECTHAAFDLARTAITALDEEAAAYVVDALYFRMTGLVRRRWNAALHAMAGTVADSLLHQYQQGTRGVPAVDPTIWHLLRAVIPVNPVYVGGPAATGGTYPHNG